jgi:hypothetical protein
MEGSFSLHLFRSEEKRSFFAREKRGSGDKNDL